MSPCNPKIVIVGRPNVGKSTLFNRMLGRRRSITDSTPGVTRDVIEEECVLAGRPVVLVDTGGIKAEQDGVFDSLTADRAVSMFAGADIILFLLEVERMTPEDELIVEKLRRYGEKVILAVNKADNSKKDELALEYYSLGFGKPLPISAEHARNMDTLELALLNRLTNLDYVRKSHVPRPVQDSLRMLDIALLGKPNVGKSTLANRLTNSQYAIVSEEPGTTRDILKGQAGYKGRQLNIIDTAGIRRKNKVAENIEYYAVNRAIKAVGEADVCLLVIDVNEGITSQDKRLAAQAVKKGTAVVLALNKWDQKNRPPDELKKIVNDIRHRFPILGWAPIVPISAKMGYGMEELLDMVLKVDQQQNQRIGTGELNRAAAEWMDFTPPPTRDGRPFKVRYVTQVSIKPASFIVFVNRAQGFPESYSRFLANQLRRTFGFDAVPVQVVIKEKT